MEQRREKINYKQLVAHKNNHYSIDGLEELADSIDEVGLLHDVIVKPTGQYNKNGKQIYVIISGHRRVQAIKRLVEKRGILKHTEVPCVVIPFNEDEIITELKLHIANVTSREMSEYDKMIAIDRMNKLLQEAKDKGFEIKGRKKEIIAYNIGLKPSQVQTYMTVATYSDDEVKDAIKKGKLKIETVHNLIKENKKKNESNILTMKQVNNSPQKTPRQKVYKKLLNFEKALEQIAAEFDDYDEIQQLIKKIEQRFEE